jgi:hypothetical protein
MRCLSKGLGSVQGQRPREACMIHHPEDAHIYERYLRLSPEGQRHVRDLSQAVIQTMLRLHLERDGGTMEENELAKALKDIRERGEKLLDEFMLLDAKDQQAILPHLKEIGAKQDQVHEAIRQIQEKNK